MWETHAMHLPFGDGWNPTHKIVILGMVSGIGFATFISPKLHDMGIQKGALTRQRHCGAGRAAGHDQRCRRWKGWENSLFSS